MREQTQQSVGDAPTPGQITTVSAAPAGSKPITADEARERKYFSPADIEAHGVPYIEQLLGTFPNMHKFSNFDMENVELVPGNGLLVQPLTKRNPKQGEPMELVGFIFAFVPDFETVVASPKGATFIENALLEVFSRKLKTTIANHDAESGEPLVLVNTLEGFLERQTRGEGLGDYQLVAPDVTKSLIKAGFKGMDKTTLRHCFMSSKFASAQYEKVPQKVWEALLDKAKALAKAKGKSGAIFDTWKSTRNERDFGAGEIDLSDLGLDPAMLAEEEHTA